MFLELISIFNQQSVSLRSGNFSNNSFLKGFIWSKCQRLQEMLFAQFAAYIWLHCGCQRDATHIRAVPCICWRKTGEEVTDMATALIFYWLAPLRLIFYWLAPLSELSLLAGSSWGRPVSRGKGGGGVCAKMAGTDTDSSIKSVGKKTFPVSTF